MVYTILISIVFIAELIIAITVIQNLLKLDKKILNFDEILAKKKSTIKEIFILLKKISEQTKVLAEDFVSKTKENAENMSLKLLSKLLISVLLLKLNFKLVKKIQQSKFTKLFAKSWSILETMV